MTTINNIPTVSDFKKSVGRYYIIERARKKNDPQMYAIFRALESAQPFRDSTTQHSYQIMRNVRKACIDWMSYNFIATRSEEPTISRLAQNVHNRMLAIITHLHRASTGLLNDLARLENARAQDAKLLLTGNSAAIGKTVDSHYNVERFTRNHFPATSQHSYNEYLAQNPTSNLGVQDFYNLVVVPLKEDDPNNMLRKNLPHNTQRVMYCNEQERQRYKVNLQGDGLLKRADGELLDTSGMRSITTGLGWGIFVVDMNQDFYVNAHAIDEFHHSSFLSGAPVFSAGEICVSDGVLVGLTNKTGHYKSGASELHRALLLLQKHNLAAGWRGGIGAGMKHVAVSDPFVGGKDKWLSAEDVIDAGGDFNHINLVNAPTMTKPTAVNMADLAESVKPLLIF